MKRKHIQKGFTIIELLAVILVFTVISSFVTAIIVTSLRGNNKTKTVTAITQNGNYAMTQLAKNIRDARTLGGGYTCGTSSSPSSATSISIIAADGTSVTFGCTDSQNNATIASNGATLLDLNAVSLSTCTFTCARSSVSDFPVIGISFSLRQKTATTFVDETASSSAIFFNTSVVLRNLNR